MLCLLSPLLLDEMYAPAKTDMEEKELLNKVIFVAFAR